MKGHLFIYLFFLVALINETTNALIFNRHRQEQELSCMKHCHDNQRDHEYVQFQLGKTYEYRVEILNQLLAQVNKSQSNDFVEENLIQINGRAQLRAINHCEVSMVLKNVELKFSKSPSMDRVDEEIEYYIKQLEKPIIFSYKDGIVTEVCTADEEDEESFVINVKKSIISSLQTISNILNDDDNTKQNTVVHQVIESDYHGDCETEYQIQKLEPENYLILKQKDLLKCINQEDSAEFSDLGYMIKESKQATSSCRQQIQSKHIIESECRSARLLDTLLEHFNIELLTKVHLVQESVTDTNDANDYEKNNSILLNDREWLRNHYRLEKSPTKSYHQRKFSSTDVVINLKEVLNQICQDIKQNSNRVGLKTLEHIKRLSQAFERDSNNVEIVWKEIIQPENFCEDQSKKLKDIFIETAASSIMNQNTASIVRDELLHLYDQQQREKNPVARERLRYLITSLAFAQNPSKEAIKKIVPELLTKVEEPEFILGISALIKQVGDRDSDDVKFRKEMYSMIINKILVAIQNPTTKEEIHVFRLLKSLENVSPKTVVEDQEKLIPIINWKQFENRIIRTSAIKSMESVQPTQKIRQLLIEIFSNVTETNEIRIVAYRTLINTGTNIEELKQILEIIQKEQDSAINRNVYNYVCSHQKILRNSVDLSKRSLLPMDAPEFPEPALITNVFLSRHYEYSYTNPKISLGNNLIEADVIMADKSDGWTMVPRSVTVNLTLPIGLNRHIPVAELTIRQEGFEKFWSKKIFDDLPRLLMQQPINNQLFERLNDLVERNDSESRLQLWLNVDGKNIFVYDSKEQNNYLSSIWNFFKERFSMHMDETMIMMPWQKRVVIEQVSSGVPIYLELNSTYIASLETTVVNKNQSMENYLEMIVKPTFVAQTNIGFGSDHVSRSYRTNQFRIVNQMLTAPTIHLRTEIKDNKQILFRFMLPEMEQTWWRSETKIIKNNQDDNSVLDIRQIPVRSSRSQMINVKCSEWMMRFFGASLCYKTKETNSLMKRKISNEILVDYSEVVLRKHNDQINGIEVMLELPEQILTPIFLPQNELKFVFSISTLSSNLHPLPYGFQTEVIVSVPNENHDQLSVEFSVDVLKKRQFQGQWTFVDNVQQKSMKLEINNQWNKQFLRVDLLGQTKLNELSFHFNIDVQSMKESKVYGGKGYVAIIGNGQPDWQLTLDSKWNIFDVQLQHHWLLSKDSKTIKFISQSRYNRFWSNQMNQFERFEIDYQSTNFNTSQMDGSKQFINYNMISSQYPSMNVEMTYNKKGQPDSVDEEFVLKYGEDFERNQLRTDRNTRVTRNIHSREVRVDTTINFEFKPKDLQYTITSSIVNNLKNDFRKLIIVDINIENRKHSQMVMNSHFTLEQITSKQFSLDIVGETKFINLGYIISYKNKIQEVEPGKYRGKIEIVNMSQFNQAVPRWLPKRSQMEYLIQVDERKDVNSLIDIWKNLHKFEHQLSFENDYGHFGHLGWVEISDEHRNHHLKAILRHEGQQVYNVNVTYDSENFKFFLETIKFDHLKINVELKWNQDHHLVIGHLMGNNQHYDHETSLNIIDKQNFNISMETKRNDQIVLLFNIFQDKYNDKLNFQTNSKYLILNIQMENFLKRSNEKDAYGTIELRIPKINVVQINRIHMIQKQPEKMITIDSQTRQNDRNVLKFNFQLQTNMGTFKGELGGDLRGQIKLENIGENIYQLNIDVQAPHRQIIYQTVARWQHKETWPMTFWNSNRLLSLDIKTHLGQRNLFDVHYKHIHDDQPCRQQLIISTLLSQTEIFWSESKVLILFKTKHLGGIEYRAELTEINFPLLKFNSSLNRNNYRLIKITGDITLKSGHKSSLDMIFGNNKYLVKMELVPMNKFQAQLQSKTGYSGSLEWNRLSSNYWTMEIKGKNLQKRSDELEIHVDHQCNEYTKIRVDSMILQGYLEHRINTRSLKIDLIGKKTKRFENFKHKTEANLDENWNKIQLKSLTTKSGKNLIAIDADFEKEKLFRFNGESELKRFPFMWNTLVNMDDWHIDFEIRDKSEDRQARFETKAKGWDDFRVQCVWGKRQDPTKKLLLESNVKSDGENKKILIRGQWFKHQFEGEVNGQQVKNLYRLQGNYADLEKNQRKMINLNHQRHPEGIYETYINCNNGLVNVLTARARLDVRNRRSIDFEMKTETDLNDIWDILNTEAKFFHKVEGGNFQQKGFIESGKRNEKKFIQLEGHNDEKTVTYELIFKTPNSSPLEQTIKLEWNKPERKLQINVYNQNGRIVDVNVDVLAKALHKKFQIVSFIDHIPTVDVEAAFGENSYLVFALSFQQKKKLELSLNWFGQWRHDYRAEILVRCFEPQFEMMIVSHHPATFDSIDAVLKYPKREIKVNWNNRFDERNDHWQRDVTVQIDGRKTLQLNVDRTKRQNLKSPDQEIIVYNSRLDGDYRAQGKAEVIVSKMNSNIKMIKMELENQSTNEQYSERYLIELFFRYQERQQESTRISGISIERVNDKPIFIATYVEPITYDESSVVNTLAHLYLSNDIDYKLFNRITFNEKYVDSMFGSIKQVKSQLKKRGTKKALADMDIFYEQEDQINVIRMKIQSPMFSNAKVFEIRFNVESSGYYCQKFEKYQQKNFSDRKCSRMQLIFGNEQHKTPVAITLEYVKDTMLQNDLFNRTILFSLETLNEPDMNRVLNFTIIAHVSSHSIGYQWENINRFGNKVIGKFYFGFKSHNETKLLDFIYRYDNEKNMEDDSYYRIHLEPRDILKTSYIDAKIWNLLKWTRWILERPPRIEQLSRRSDLCEWRIRMIQELKDEIRYKWHLFKRQAIDRELVVAIMNEVNLIRSQIESSQDPIVINFLHLMDKFIEILKDLYDQVDLEENLDDALIQINQFIENYQNELIKMMEHKCFENEYCLRLYRKVQNSEIERLIRSNLVETIQEHLMSQSLMNIWKDFQSTKESTNHSFVDQVKPIYDQFPLFISNFVSNVADQFNIDTKKIGQKNWSEWLFEKNENKNNPEKNHLWNNELIVW